ncbi:GNAT family N-acetyltransferase [Sphingobacterium tabacisoli]|uniref:GNAT family N-acetyltransferase n=1 Tax=Sphingobacterium tabacisoli TaxID=2044855 RepID=A0ABW5L5F9_9SPHI|nr:GNAT family N-acetyltransferase [Sphingobacterium tabacisoli]
MQIRKLTNQDIPDLLLAINGSFADYIVPFQLNSEQLDFKMTSEDIQMDYSVGVFEDGKLVAFIMHGLRPMGNDYKVYNAGTGVLPDYRGRGLVGQMYAHIVPFLQAQGVKKMVLEVIESNRSAIRAYEKEGFTINRKLLCFSGTLENVNENSIALLKTLSSLPWDALSDFWDITPSWQSDIRSMQLVPPSILGAFIADELVGYILFNTTKRRIYQLAVSPSQRHKGIAQQLTMAVQQQIPAETIQVNNVDEASTDLELFLKKQGLQNDINQLEMTKSI